MKITRLADPYLVDPLGRYRVVASAQLLNGPSYIITGQSFSLWTDLRFQNEKFRYDSQSPITIRIESEGESVILVPDAPCIVHGASNNRSQTVAGRSTTGPDDQPLLSSAAYAGSGSAPAIITPQTALGLWRWGAHGGNGDGLGGAWMSVGPVSVDIGATAAQFAAPAWTRLKSPCALAVPNGTQYYRTLAALTPPNPSTSEMLLVTAPLIGTNGDSGVSYMVTVQLPAGIQRYNQNGGLGVAASFIDAWFSITLVAAGSAAATNIGMVTLSPNIGVTTPMAWSNSINIGPVRFYGTNNYTFFVQDGSTQWNVTNPDPSTVTQGTGPNAALINDSLLAATLLGRYTKTDPNFAVVCGVSIPGWVTSIPAGVEIAITPMRSCLTDQDMQGTITTSVSHS